MAKMKKNPAPPYLRKLLDDYCAAYPKVPVAAGPSEPGLGVKKSNKLATFVAGGLFAISGPWSSRKELSHPSKSLRDLQQSLHSMRPFRFFDLPAELRTLILEEVARDNYIDGWPVTVSADARALLHTCRSIRRDFPPVLFEHAEIRLRVDDWNFDSFGKLCSHLETFPLVKKAISGNKRIHSVIKAQPWQFEDNEHKIQAWLAVCLAQPRMDFTYDVFCSSDFRCARSRSQFLWTTGTQEIRGIGKRLKGHDDVKFKRRQLHRVLRAFERQALQWETDITAAETVWRERRKALSSYQKTDDLRQAAANQVWRRGGNSREAQAAYEYGWRLESGGNVKQLRSKPNDEKRVYPRLAATYGAWKNGASVSGAIAAQGGGKTPRKIKYSE